MRDNVGWSNLDILTKKGHNLANSGISRVRLKLKKTVEVFQ
jgi:hypothetical protein